MLKQVTRWLTNEMEMDEEGLSTRKWGIFVKCLKWTGSTKSCLINKSTRSIDQFAILAFQQKASIVDNFVNPTHKFSSQGWQQKLEESLQNYQELIFLLEIFFRFIENKFSLSRKSFFWQISSLKLIVQEAIFARFLDYLEKCWYGLLLSKFCSMA